MFSRALKMLRLFNQMSQVDLAKELQISPAYLCQVESGKRSPTVELLQKYSSVFKIPLSNLCLFSEKLESNSLSEQSRVYLANRLLRLMEVLTEAGQEEEQGTVHGTP
jgi:transcriptional regulator with XRE-family HTH domain